MEKYFKRKGRQAMRLLQLLMLTLNISVLAEGAAQISLNVKNAPLEKVMDEVKRQSGYDFVINIAHLNLAKPVTASISKQSLENTLKVIFKAQPLTYEIGDKVIYVTLSGDTEKKTIPDKRNDGLPQRSVRGTVRDSIGNPLPFVSVKVKGTSVGTMTDLNGVFSLSEVPGHAILQFSRLGYGYREVEADQDILLVYLTVSQTEIAEVDVTVNTGYQKIPKERATGSFVVVDTTIINRNPSTGILERLNGMVPGLSFTDVSDIDVPGLSTIGRPVGIEIRGVSTLSNNVNRAPLIVLDNFPYEGDIRNLNPNDIENISILKDAAAASIWGAKSGNGVIVITTKKGKRGEPVRIEASANISVQSKPDLRYDRNFLNAKDYIGVERILYESGYFDADINDNINYTPVSPAVELLHQLKAPGLSGPEKENLGDQLARLEQIDIRNDLDKYFYRNGVKQQYSLGLRGGAEKVTYSLFTGYDKNLDNLVRNGVSRTTINSQTSYKPAEGLEISAGILYSQNSTDKNNEFPVSYGMNMGGSYMGVYPYAKLVGEGEEALAITKDYKPSYIHNSQSQGFYDWSFRPFDELNVNDKYTKISNLIIRANATYNITKALDIELFYQNERQRIYDYHLNSIDRYFTRNLINRFSFRNPDGSFLYQVPNTGGILSVGQYDWISNNARAQLNYDRVFNRHSLTAIAGVELRETDIKGSTRTSYGYDKQFGSSNNALNFLDFLPVNPVGSAKIPSPDGSVSGTLNRYISQYANASYSYKNTYTFSASARRDGANLFGVQANDKITPLWSIGAAWTLSNEDFLKNSIIGFLRLRTTFGYNGNIYHGSAYVTGSYYSSSRTGLPVIIALSAPNPELSWEKVRNFNVGLDFSLFSNQLSGSVEFYQKDGRELIQNIELAPSTGFTNYFANSAATSSRGFDLNIASRNLNKLVKWTTNLNLSLYGNKISAYNVPLSNSSISSPIMGAVGKPLSGIFSYKWEGLDPATGEPQGRLNGIVSKDYSGIQNNYSADSLVFNGPASPKVFGNLRNDFSYKDFGLSFSFSYKFGHVFRRSSIGLSYADIIQGYQHADYSTRWQKPGDETRTSVPSVQNTQNFARNNFYQYSEALVEDAGHIRFQDIRLSYNLKEIKSLTYFRSLELFAYANNLGIIWRANKLNLDPDVISSVYTHFLPQPMTISFGMRASF